VNEALRIRVIPSSVNGGARGNGGRRDSKRRYSHGRVGNNGLIDVVDHLRRHGVRGISLGMARAKEEKLVPDLISRGVSDLLVEGVDDIAGTWRVVLE